MSDKNSLEEEDEDGHLNVEDLQNNENKLQVQIHKFTDRFKTFSNDFIRTIERAHDIADLHNSKFAHATVAAAAAAADSENTESSDDNQILETIDENQNQQENQLDEVEQCFESVKNELNYEKLINNKNNLKNLIDKSYLDNVEQQTTTKQLNPNDISTNSSLYLSTTTLSEPYSHLNHVDFCIKPNIKRTDSYSNIPDGIYISIWEVFIYLWGCIAFFIDIISDIILSVGYYNMNKRWLCALTLLFVIVPNVTLSLFSLSWYIDNYYTIKNFKKNNNNKNGDEPDLGNFNANKRYRSNLDDSLDLNSHRNQDTMNKNKSTFDSITFWITTIIFLILQLDLVYK
jgi:hypothetical protein